MAIGNDEFKGYIAGLEYDSHDFEHAPAEYRIQFIEPNLTSQKNKILIFV